MTKRQPKRATRKPRRNKQGRFVGHGGTLHEQVMPSEYSEAHGMRPPRELDTAEDDGMGYVPDEHDEPAPARPWLTRLWHWLLGTTP